MTNSATTSNGSNIYIDDGSDKRINIGGYTPLKIGGDQSSIFYTGNGAMFNKNLFKKLADIMAEVGWISKGDSVEINGKKAYDYTSEAQFIAEVRPLFIKHRVMIMPTGTPVVDVKEFQKSGDRVSYLTTITLNYSFIDADSGETMNIIGIGQGSDSGDKGVYKAMTGALKYAIRQALFIGTGDDPERYDSDGNVVSSSNGKAESQTDRGLRMVKTQLNTMSADMREYADGVLAKHGVKKGKLPNDVQFLRRIYLFLESLNNGEDASIAEDRLTGNYTPPSN